MKTPTRAGGLMEMQERCVGKASSRWGTQPAPDNYSNALKQVWLYISSCQPRHVVFSAALGNQNHHHGCAQVRKQRHRRTKQLAPQLVGSPAEIQACGSQVFTLTHHTVGRGAKAGRKPLASGPSMRAACETEQERMRNRDSL